MKIFHTNYLTWKFPNLQCILVGFQHIWRKWRLVVCTFVCLSVIVNQGMICTAVVWDRAYPQFSGFRIRWIHCSVSPPCSVWSISPDTFTEPKPLLYTILVFQGHKAEPRGGTTWWRLESHDPVVPPLSRTSYFNFLQSKSPIELEVTEFPTVYYFFQNISIHSKCLCSQSLVS